MTKKMYSSVAVFKIIFFVIFILFTFNSFAMAAPIVLKFSTPWPPPEKDMSSALAKIWMDKVTEKTKGAIKFKPFWGGALGSPAEQLNLVSKGVVDLVLFTRLYAPGQLPLGEFEYAFPFHYPKNATIAVKAKRKMYEEFPAFREELKKVNTALIFCAPGLPYVLLSKTEIKSLDDFKKKKIAQIGRYFGRWIQASGATPVGAPATERYVMLQSGVVDVDLMPMNASYAFKVHEVAPYYIQTDIFLGLFVDLIINLKTLNKLSPEFQKIFIETGKEVELIAAEEEGPKWINFILDEWKKAGVKFVPFPDEEMQKWISLVDDIPAEWAAEESKKGAPAAEMVQRYQELCEEQGYKWPRKWGGKK